MTFEIANGDKEFTCWLVDDSYQREDTEEHVQAVDHAHAAEIFGERWDVDGYPLSQGGVITVAVLGEDETEPHQFKVEADVSPTYIASLQSMPGGETGS